MEIRRLEISNFRGIKELTWKVPAGRRFVALVGPGDSSKSTILAALDMALSDRWNLAFADTDFYDADITQPITIRVTLAGLPPELRQHGVLGMHLSGLDEDVSFRRIRTISTRRVSCCLLRSMRISSRSGPSTDLARAPRRPPSAPIPSSTGRPTSYLSFPLSRWRSGRDAGKATARLSGPGS